jgi:transcriptional regulator with XRE-family HTH domain
MISERLRKFRLMESRNQQGVAKVAGMTQAAWAGWEKNPPKALESVVALAKHFGVSADYLLTLTDDPTPRHGKLDSTSAELTQLIYQLPSWRRRDLLAMARTYLDMQQSDDQVGLLNYLLDMYESYAGKEGRDKLLTLLNRAEENRGENGRGLLDDGSDQASNGDS